MPFLRRPAPGLNNDVGFRSVSGRPVSSGRFRRFIVRHRRLIAALACCAAAGAAVQALVPPEAQHAPIVQAAHDLPAGSVLEAGSLATGSIPSDAVPPGAHSHPDGLLGRRLATPLLQGSPVTELSLAGPGLLSGAPPGTVAIPLRPADPSVLDLLAPGQPVTVVAAPRDGAWEAAPGGVDGGADGAVVLATSVPVLWVSGAGSTDGWPAASSGTGEGLVVVAADRKDAARLTAASGAGGIYLVLTGG